MIQLVSRPRELPPQPLVEPCVSLSTHTAPLTEPCHTTAASEQTAPPPGATLSPASDDSGASARAGSCTSGVPPRRASSRHVGRRSTLRGGETPVVLPPASHNGAGGRRQCAQTLCRLARPMPRGELLPHPLLGRAARPGQEARQAFSHAMLRPPRPKRNAPEGNLTRGIVGPALAVLAVDTPCLVRSEEYTSE